MTIARVSSSYSPIMSWFVVVVCTKGRTFTSGATDTIALTLGTTTRGATLGRTSGVTTVCTDTTGSTETMGLTTVRTDTSGARCARGARGVGSGAALGAAAGAADGCGTALGAAGAGAGAAGDCADCMGGTAGGSVVCGAGCCVASEWMLIMVGRNAAM